MQKLFSSVDANLYILHSEHELSAEPYPDPGPTALEISETVTIRLAVMLKY
jgi:hypothetical protein